MERTNYGFSKIVNLGYDEAIEKVTEELYPKRLTMF